MTTTSTFASALPWLLLLAVAGSRAEMLCEDVPADFCAFSVSSAGKRCVLEDYVGGGGRKEYQCRASEVAVEIAASEHIESEECVRACGVDRRMAGISSDGLHEPEFMVRLCSPECYANCPYIVDLYSNLAAGEGGNLLTMCERQREPHRATVELMSSGAAPGPVSPDFSKMSSGAASGPVSPDFSEMSSGAASGPVSPDFSEMSSEAAPGPVSPDFSEVAAAPGPSFAPTPRRSLFGFSF